MDVKSTSKICMVGSSGCGKSCLVSRLRDNSFNDFSKPTVGMDRLEVKAIIQEKHSVPFLIWDTAGMDKFRGLYPFYYKGAKAVIVVFDLTDKLSFQKLDDFRLEIENFSNLNAIKYLIGNKKDEDDKRDVPPKSEILDMSLILGFKKYFEVSALENIDKEINTIFNQIFNDIFEIEEWDERTSPLDNMKLRDVNSSLSAKSGDSKGCV